MGLVQFVLTMASTSFQKVWKSTAFLPIRLILGYLSFGAGFDLAKTPPIHGFIYLSPSPLGGSQQHGHLGKDMVFSSQPLNFIYQIFTNLYKVYYLPGH